MPGPGAYNPKNEKFREKSLKFSKSSRDFNDLRSMSPGPGSYSYKDVISEGPKVLIYNYFNSFYFSMVYEAKRMKNYWMIILDRDTIKQIQIKLNKDHLATCKISYK